MILALVVAGLVPLLTVAVGFSWAKHQEVVYLRGRLSEITAEVVRRETGLSLAEIRPDPPDSQSPERLMDPMTADRMVGLSSRM